MACRRGEVWLANFNPSKGTEAGKIRPCLDTEEMAVVDEFLRITLGLLDPDLGLS